MTQYSFCESDYATSISPWCIRKLTDQGQKPGGGIDTPSLCGRVTPRLYHPRSGTNGWDIPNVPVTLTHPAACPKCLEIWKERGET